MLSKPGICTVEYEAPYCLLVYSSHKIALHHQVSLQQRSGKHTPITSLARSLLLRIHSMSHPLDFNLMLLQIGSESLITLLESLSVVLASSDVYEQM